MRSRSIYFFLHAYIILIYSCVFVIPSVIGDTEIGIVNYVFFLGSAFLLLIIMLTSTVQISDILMILLILFIAFRQKRVNVFSWIGPVILYRLVRLGYMEYIKDIVTKTRMNYVSLLFTLFYSAVYGLGNLATSVQVIRTAVSEINMSGLAVLCLGTIIRKTNRIAGNLTLLLGMFSLSRNYYLSFFVIFILCTGERFNKSLYALFKRHVLSFASLMIGVAVILIGLNVLYQHWRIAGELTYKVGIARIFNLKDYSNYNRFAANITLMNTFLNNPQYIFTGIPDIQEYRDIAQQTAQRLGTVYVRNPPHNFLFSYIRLYGIVAVILLLYIQRALKILTSQHNIGIYLAVCVYAIFMSAGFNTYWLFLTCFTMLVYQNETPRLVPGIRPGMGYIISADMLEQTG